MIFKGYLKDIYRIFKGYLKDIDRAQFSRQKWISSVSGLDVGEEKYKLYWIAFSFIHQHPSLIVLMWRAGGGIKIFQFCIRLSCWPSTFWHRAFILCWKRDKSWTNLTSLTCVGTYPCPCSQYMVYLKYKWPSENWLVWLSWGDISQVAAESPWFSHYIPVWCAVHGVWAHKWCHKHKYDISLEVEFVDFSYGVFPPNCVFPPQLSKKIVFVRHIFCGPFGFQRICGFFGFQIILPPRLPDIQAQELLLSERKQFKNNKCVENLERLYFPLPPAAARYPGTTIVEPLTDCLLTQETWSSQLLGLFFNHNHKVNMF